MWFKLIGAGLLLVCGTLGAREQTRRRREELACAAAFGELFTRIRVQIETLCLPLDEILLQMPPSVLEACGCHDVGTVRRVSQLLPAMERVSDPAAREILLDAAARLGRGSREDQVSLCRTTVEALTARCETWSAEAARDARARETLVLTGCLGGIILLW